MRTGIVVAAVAGAVAAPLVAQECETDRSSGHSGWHDQATALAALEDELAAILTDAGQAPLGSVVLRWSDGDEPEVERPMVSVPRAAEQSFAEAIRRSAPRVRGEHSEVRIDFGAPRPDLWPDRTERCDPELDNVAEAGGLLAQVMAGAIQREGKARPAGRVRLDFWVLVDWTGRVTAIEFREDQGTWNWLVPYLEAMGPALRYRPATLNGAARTAWVAQQFELEF